MIDVKISFHVFLFLKNKSILYGQKSFIIRKSIVHLLRFYIFFIRVLLSLLNYVIKF